MVTSSSRLNYTSSRDVTHRRPADSSISGGNAWRLEPVGAYLVPPFRQRSWGLQSAQSGGSRAFRAGGSGNFRATGRWCYPRGGVPM